MKDVRYRQKKAVSQRMPANLTDLADRRIVSKPKYRVPKTGCQKRGAKNGVPKTGRQKNHTTAVGM